ncbi:MAG: HAMP domain-containing histidine kinase [Ruminococcaceae bacterium]|nr:HAMP domain-containing histidine kinase [Oscillospiraceae bacterium]
MLMVILVLFALFFSLTYVTYSFQVQLSEEALKTALTCNPGDALFTNGKVVVCDEQNFDKNNDKLHTVFLIVVTDKEGKITASDTSANMFVSPENVRKVTELALRDEEDIGIISSYTVRFMKIPHESGGYKIAFADRTSEVAIMAFLIRLYFAATLFMCAIMYLISRHMAKKAVEPVEKSWEDQSRFIADASHELKTPLTVILANMDIMDLNPDSTVAEQKKWIDNTKSEAKRMTELVNDMLFLARSDAAVDQRYNFMDVELASVVKECILAFESVAFEKGIQFSVVSILDNIIVNGDEAKLKQAIMILLDNALKYVDKKGSIMVSMARTQRYVKILILNTGKPIPIEKQKNLFERFYRTDDSRSREVGGYGLGLAIASNILEYHNGRAALEYSDENGTCFSYTLPIKMLARTRFAKK